MLFPYQADINGYDSKKDFLNTAINCVTKVEKSCGSPEVWTVWEYSFDYPATPES